MSSCCGPASNQPPPRPHAATHDVDGNHEGGNDHLERRNGGKHESLAVNGTLARRRTGRHGSSAGRPATALGHARQLRRRASTRELASSECADHRVQQPRRDLRRLRPERRCTHAGVRIRSHRSDLAAQRPLLHRHRDHAGWRSPGHARISHLQPTDLVVAVRSDHPGLRLRRNGLGDRASLCKRRDIRRREHYRDPHRRHHGGTHLLHAGDERDPHELDDLRHARS